MNDWPLILTFLLAGLILLIIGAELLVRGASSLAAALGISPLVIGLTVVAFGTSAPELAVSIEAALSGSSNIAVANVVGSNIFNVLAILGLCALVMPLVVSLQLVRREVPIMIAVSLLMGFLAMDGRISLLDGVFLFSVIVIYTSWSIVVSRKEMADEGVESAVEELQVKNSNWLLAAFLLLGFSLIGYWQNWLVNFVAALLAVGSLLFIAGCFLGNKGPKKTAGTFRQLGLILAGLGALVLGANYLVESSTTIARALGVSDVIIGLTIVAAGTSLPELATSVVATIRNQRDIAIGNVVGSNIFNILSILGLAAIVSPNGLTVDPSMIRFDIPIMIAVALSCLPIFFTGFTVARWEGGLFLASYIAYTVFLILVATKNPALETFSNAMLIIMPLVFIVLCWTVVQAIRRRQTH